MRKSKFPAAASIALIAAALSQTEAQAKTITVAVVDTGISSRIPHLCKHGHKSFIDSHPNVDDNGHGTRMASIINTNAGKGDYCLVAIKWYDMKASASQNMDRLHQALHYAANIKVDIINISGGGNSADRSEEAAILEALQKHITVVAAAGNDGSDLGKLCNYFPACYDERIITVGNTMHTHDSANRAPSSNYGNYVKVWEVGTNVPATAPDGRTVYDNGTSPATAAVTGKLIHKRLHK